MIWARQAANFMFSGSDFDITDTLVVYPEHAQLNAIDRLRANPSLAEKYFYPLVLIPLTTKLYNKVKGHSEDLVQNAKKLIVDASELFVIGYRAADELFQEELLRITPSIPVHVVGTDSADGIMKDVLEKGSLGVNQLKEGKTHKDGFLQFARDYEPTD